jgi:hypothetical protein
MCCACISAMYMERPVIACNSGGPLETVGYVPNPATPARGFICPSDATAFAAAMRQLVEDTQLAPVMGAAGTRHMVSQFSFGAFKSKLDRLVQTTVYAATGDASAGPWTRGRWRWCVIAPVVLLLATLVFWLGPALLNSA